MSFSVGSYSDDQHALRAVYRGSSILNPGSDAAVPSQLGGSGVFAGRWIHARPQRPMEIHWPITCLAVLSRCMTTAKSMLPPVHSTTEKTVLRSKSRQARSLLSLRHPFRSSSHDAATAPRVCENDQHPMSMGRRACCLPAFVCLFPSPTPTAAALCRNRQCRGTC
jgi:hypothetical protein